MVYMKEHWGLRMKPVKIRNQRPQMKAYSKGANCRTLVQAEHNSPSHFCVHTLNPTWSSVADHLHSQLWTYTVIVSCFLKRISLAQPQGAAPLGLDHHAHSKEVEG